MSTPSASEPPAYTLTLYAPDDSVSEAERRAAEQRFRQALDGALGDAALVWPVRAAYLRIVAVYGEEPGPDTLTSAERELFDQWQAAEAAAVVAAFGPNRYLDEARFEIGP